MIVSSGYVFKNGVDTYIEDIDMNTSNVDMNIDTSNIDINTSNIDMNIGTSNIDMNTSNVDMNTSNSIQE